MRGKMADRPIASAAIWQAALRIAVVAACAGIISYFVNAREIKRSVEEQLRLSTGLKLKMESLEFAEAKTLQRNFLAEFARAYADPARRAALTREFDLFYRELPDGSYVQRPGIFEGAPLADGRTFADMSATYSPEFPPDGDVKARMALSFRLCHKYGSSAKGRVFNFYGVVPEKGFPVYQEADVSRWYSYVGDNPLDLMDYEFYRRGFEAGQTGPFLTGMYYDASNDAWMTTLATPAPPDATGRRNILACTDISLKDLMERTAQPTLPGTVSVVFMNDADGTLICDPALTQAIADGGGKATVRSLDLAEYYPVLDCLPGLKEGDIRVIDGPKALIAAGLIPETPWVLAVMYPKGLMRASAAWNLMIIVLLGLASLTLEITALRSALKRHVAIPLKGLIAEMRRVGRERYGEGYGRDGDGENEITALIGEYGRLSDRVREAREGLEEKVAERTGELTKLNERLTELSETDQLTGIGNRRHFDESFRAEWERARRSGARLSLILGDVDWFKKYNDIYGHPRGDSCLREVAQALKGAARRATDAVARYGGEEFAVLLPESEGDQAQRVAEGIIQAFARLNLPHGGSEFGHVTMSLGVSVATPKRDIDPEKLLKAADEALYRAKRAGRNRWESVDVSP